VSEITSDPSQAWPPECETPGLGEAPKPPRILLHVVLFLATVVTTVVAGAFQFGVNLFEHPWQVYRGIPFAVSILAILATHEMGHYLMSRRHQLNVTLPYFLPGIPYPPPLPGTFGALIRIRSPILDKRTLLDVGCSGPLSGLVVVVPVLVVGLKLSKVATLPPDAGLGITLGEPLLFKLVSWLTLGPLGPNEHVLIHPVAFAGWLGLLITALNLLPVGQLDGGHVIYALFPRWHRRISIAILGMLVVFGILSWHGWLVWAVILSFLGTRHPPPYCDWIALDRRRRILGAITILVFILTFSPMPFSLG
jgi:membrane-associated protease RseP (regulator of RpoE activity)